MRQRSTRTAVFAAAVVACSVSFARAEHASVALDYSVAEAPTTCPDESTFRGLVAARLGYDPFTGKGPRALSVGFARRGNEVTGRLKYDDGEEKRAERTLRASPEECFELGTSMALIAAVAIDPDASAEPEPPSTTEPTEAAPPVAEAAAPEPRPPRATPPPAGPPAVAAPAPSGRAVRLELSALLPVNVVPALSVGVRAGAGLDFGAWSLSAEGEFLFKGSRENPAGAGEVSALVLAGSLVPCAHPFGGETFVIELCAVGSLGALRSTANEVTRAEPTSDLYATVGPRLATVVMVSDAMGLGLSADLPVALSRVHLSIEEDSERHEVWAAPPIGFIGAFSLVARLK